MRHNWKKRWFVLQGNRLRYFEKPPKDPSKGQLGEIALHKGSVAIDSSTQKDFMFTIQAAMVDGEKKNYLVKAGSAAEMHEWIDAIGIAGKDAAQGPPPPVAPRRPTAQEASSSELELDGADASSAAAGGELEEPDFSAAAAAGADELYRLKFKYDGCLSHANCLRETKLCNVHFLWSGLPNVVLGAHDFVLSMRAPRLGPAGLGHLLYVIYCDELPGFRSGQTNLAPLDLVRLLNAATLFGLPRCVALCQAAFVETCLNHETAYAVLKEAHDIGCEWAKSGAIDYVHRYIKDFVKNKEESKKLGLDLFQEVVCLTSEEYVQRAGLTVDVPEPTLKADFRALYDRTLNGEGDAMVKIQMQVIRFHRSLLSAHAKGLAQLFLSDKNSFLEDATLILGVKGLSPDAFRAMLRFIYYGDDNIATTHACDIQQFAERMFMHDFQSICQDVIGSSISSVNVMTVLQMTYHEARDQKEMMVLRQKALAYLVENIADIDLSHINNLSIAMDILTEWQRWVRDGYCSILSQSSFSDNIVVNSRHSSGTFARLPFNPAAIPSPLSATSSSESSER